MQAGGDLRKVAPKSVNTVKTTWAIAVVLVTLARPAWASFSQTFSEGVVIPDDNMSGQSFTVNVPDSFAVGKVTVGLNLSGG